MQIDMPVDLRNGTFAHQRELRIPPCTHHLVAVLFNHKRFMLDIASVRIHHDGIHVTPPWLGHQNIPAHISYRIMRMKYISRISYFIASRNSNCTRKNLIKYISFNVLSLVKDDKRRQNDPDGLFEALTYWVVCMMRQAADCLLTGIAGRVLIHQSLRGAVRYLFPRRPGSLFSGKNPVCVERAYRYLNIGRNAAGQLQRQIAKTTDAQE
jgi:hypothetical protein